MAETIESFVAKLQTEGVEAGKQAAEKLLSDARRQAEKIVSDAEAQAKKILSDAETQGASLLERSRGELQLAARDVVLRLQTALVGALQAVLTAKVKQQLPDSEFLSHTLHDLVLEYAKADVEHKQRMQINVSPQTQSELADWALQEMTARAAEAGMSIDLRGTLSTAGFEYEVTGGTVEVTVESVVETLSEMVSPQLRQMVQQAAGDFQTGSDQTESQE